VARGITAAALPCEADFAGYTACVLNEVPEGDHHARQRTSPDPVPRHCRLCASGWHVLQRRILMTMSKTSLVTVIAALSLAACGGGGSDGSNAASNDPGGTEATAPTPASTTATTPGVWKGTITSTTTGRSSTALGLIATNGQSFWMTTDGRVWNGQMPVSGTQFNTTMAGHMYAGDRFPDGSNYGPSSMMFGYSSGMWGGSYTGTGDTGTFNMGLSPMWNRPASLAEVAGVYTRTVSYGYAMTMTIDANGQFSASDTRGCLINGTVAVPDATHNLYRLDATVSSCGALNGTYNGMGTLLDADAMRDWMTAMQPFDCGWYTMGGGMMGGGMMGGWQPPVGQNTIPGGLRNLFVFALVNDHYAIMDALAR
jgi:hypothetical protein